jgi:hypothetical protein
VDYNSRSIVERFEFMLRTRDVLIYSNVQYYSIFSVQYFSLFSVFMFFVLFCI